MSTMGEVDIRQESPESVVVTWIVGNLNDLKEAASPRFKFACFNCLMEANTVKPGYIQCSVWCIDFNSSVKIKPFLLSEERSLLEFPIQREEYTKEGTVMFAEIPLPENGKESMIPGRVLTLVVKLELVETTPEEAEPKYSSSNKLEVIPSSLELTFPIPDFCELPYNLDTGILSKDFPIPNGSAFFALFPHGNYTERERILLSVVIECGVNRGLRTPEMDCEVALKTAEGTLYRSLSNEETLGSNLCIFSRYFERSEVIRRKESLVPGGVLTFWIKLCSRRSSE